MKENVIFGKLAITKYIMCGLIFLNILNCDDSSISTVKNEVIIFQKCTLLSSGCDIYTMNFTGKKLKNLTDDITHEVSMPRVSKDGKTIMFLAKASTGQSYMIYTMSSSGKNKTEIPNTENVVSACWFDAETKIVFESGGLLYKIALDGTEKELLNITGTTPSVSPDGKKVLYTANTKDGVQAIHIADIDGDNQKVLGLDKTSNAVWSRDGKKIAYRLWNDSTKSYSPYIMNSDGKSPISADDNSFIVSSSPNQPGWKNGGSHIVFDAYPKIGDYKAYYQIYSASSNGSSVKCILNDKSFCMNPSSAILVTDDTEEETIYLDYHTFLLNEINFARTKPAEYAQTRLTANYENGSDNGAYAYLSAMTALPEIAYNDYITSAAISYSEYLSTNNAMEHNANGTPKSRLAAKGYSYYAGEILAFGNSDDYNTTVNSESASINFIRDIIIDSQSFDINRRNLVLSPDVKKTGIGYKNNPASTYKNIIVVVFGSY